ncbi:hypothetical protein [Brevibacillus dissolubilis]|uniref:hypothetical protein n=1 Tax=Brevibacillus dissolubilis TaxID=1844116 RepID=UPI00159BB88F|nr:hypothetical protein [Brevibacillus dissolubilis]
MNKMISVLAVMVLTLPISVSLLFNGPDNLMQATTRFFQRLMEEAARFGTSG